MECADCSIRSAVGYCHECEILLCEVCSHSCERCGKEVCRSHIQRTSSGRNICVSCVVLHYDKRARQSKERRERRAEQAAVGKTRKSRKRESQNLSFESLTGDADSPPVQVADARPGYYQPTAMADQEALNARVLTGSAGRRTPVWISGLAMGAVAWLLCLTAMRDAEVELQQAILNFVALLLSAGTVAWTAGGALSKSADTDRQRARIACAIGAGALLVSVALYVSRAKGMV